MKETKKQTDHHHTNNKKYKKNLFDNSLPNKNAFLKALHKQLEVEEAFNKVNQTLSPPNIFQLTSLQALEFYKILQSSYSLKPFYYNLMTYLLRRCANYDRLDLVEIFFAQFIQDINVNKKEKHLIERFMIKVWNTLSGIYAEKGLFDEVRILYERMDNYATRPNNKTYTTLIKSTKNIHHCFIYLEKLIVKGYKINLEALNSVLRLCLISSSTGSYRQEIIKIIMKQMSIWGINPNGETFRTLLQSCQNFEHLEKLWSKIMTLGFHHNQALQVEIMKICLKLAFQDEGIKIENKYIPTKKFIETREAGLSKCLDYLLRMHRKSQGEMAIGAYNNLLKDCILKGDIDRVMKILEIMWSKNLEPSIRVYQQLLDNLGRLFVIHSNNNIIIHPNNLSPQTIFIKSQRKYLWKLLEEMFARPKTSIMSKRIINSIVHALAISHIPPIIINSSQASPLSQKLFNKLPTYLEPNQETIETLFSNLRTLIDFKKFGIFYFNSMLSRTSVNITKGGLENVIMNVIKNNIMNE
ncbi:3407_t:CDS:2 [Diversispora eburnea]|uniref:3407_t:CDS:1 n=1 Tax=Diversispora eburnea TaxID=1213867 RepID=A0A9N8WJC3_9GLOM|nr:3407_t:CDS:2 [Diversispora eburnea]